MSFEEQPSDLELLELMSSEIRDAVERGDGAWEEADLENIESYIQSYIKYQGMLDVGRQTLEQQKEFLARYYVLLDKNPDNEKHAGLWDYLREKIRHTEITIAQTEASMQDLKQKVPKPSQ